MHQMMIIIVVPRSNDYNKSMFQTNHMHCLQTVNSSCLCSGEGIHALHVQLLF